MRKQKTIKVLCASVMALTLAGGHISATTANTIKTEHDLIELQRPQAGGNLIKDGSFEEGRSSWKKTGDGGFTNYEGCAASGKWCGLLPLDTKNAAVYQVVNVKPNTEYVAKAKFCFGNDKASAFFNVKTPDVSTLINNAEITVKPDSAWNYKNVELTFNSGNHSEIALCAMKWTESTTDEIYKGQVYVDDFELVEKNATSTDVEEKYDIVWADDFNGKELDKTKWGYELGCIRGIEQQHYVADKENVFMRDGNLVLKATDRDKEDQYDHPRDNSRKVIYNSGSVRTHGKQEFLYGRLEMRAKLPKGQGVFPAFWTLGSDFPLDGRISGKQGYGWARCGEIDIMELTGERANNSHGNRTVYQTAHTDYQGYKKYAGTAYTIDEEFNNDYHVFGLNWSPNKLEWYVDGKIVTTLDYSNDIKAQRTLNRPQYIQFNLAMGGAWPGPVDTDLAGTEFDIDYVYYGQTAEQKAAAQEYYADAPKLQGFHNVTMHQGQTPDLLKDVSTTGDYFVDFSVENEPMFQTKGGLTEVKLLCKGKDDVAKLAELPVGTYNLHYTAIPNNVEYENNGNNIKNGTDYKFDRKTVTLTVKEPVKTDKLDTLINDVEKFLENKDQYNANAIKALEEKLAAAKELLKQNPTQEQIDAMVKELQAVYDVAKDSKNGALIPLEPSKPSKPVVPLTPLEESKPVVQTGDNTMASLYAMGLLVAVAGVVVFVKKRKTLLQK